MQVDVGDIVQGDPGSSASTHGAHLECRNRPAPRMPNRRAGRRAQPGPGRPVRRGPCRLSRPTVVGLPGGDRVDDHDPARVGRRPHGQRDEALGAGGVEAEQIRAGPSRRWPRRGGEPKGRRRCSSVVERSRRAAGGRAGAVRSRPCGRRHRAGMHGPSRRRGGDEQSHGTAGCATLTRSARTPRSRVPARGCGWSSRRSPYSVVSGRWCSARLVSGREWVSWCIRRSARGEPGRRRTAQAKLCSTFTDRRFGPKFDCAACRTSAPFSGRTRYSSARAACLSAFYCMRFSCRSRILIDCRHGVGT